MQQDEIKLPGSNEFGQVDQIDIEESLKDLADDLMGSDEQNHLPLGPVADLVHVTENHINKNQLTHEPKRFNDHPQEKVQLETHIPNDGIAQHHRINSPVFPQGGHREQSFEFWVLSFAWTSAAYAKPNPKRETVTVFDRILRTGPYPS